MNPTPPNIEREAKSKLVELIGIRCKECNEDCFACQMWAAIDTYVEQAVKEARLDELDQLWLASCERGCKKCTFEQIMTCNGEGGKDCTVGEHRKRLRERLATPHQKEEGGE